jgi:hypothetical protein
MQGSTVMRQRHAETLAPEEPDEFIAHVRVCGGGRVGNHRLYPEADANSLRSCLAAALGAAHRKRSASTLQLSRKEAARC